MLGSNYMPIFILSIQQAEENKRRNKQKAQQQRENEDISIEPETKPSNPKGGGKGLETVKLLLLH